VVYAVDYIGLEDVRRALKDMEKRKVWGRAVVTISDEGSSNTSRL